MSTEVSVQDEGSFKAGLDQVRSDESKTNWALFGHWEGNPNILYFVDSGEEGVEEMADRLLDKEVQYALVRLEEVIDMSTTIKFAYVRWSGCDVPFTKRGKYGVIHGSIEKRFSPSHIAIETDSRDDLTMESVMNKLQEQSGTKSNVIEATVAKTRQERGFTSGTTTKMDSTGSAPTQATQVKKIGKMGSSFTGMTGMAKSSGGVRVEEDVQEAIGRVRDNSSPEMWCAVGYVDNSPKNPLTVLGKGEDMEDFVSLCQEDNILYGLIRVTDVVDDIPTVKFVYIQWIGESVKPMSKAKVSTHKGALEKHFKPFHVSIFATLSSEINNRVITDKVSSASGSKINIRS